LSGLEKHKIKSGFIKDGKHKVFYKTYGNPSGKPILAIHGGEGYVFEPKNINFFNPKEQHIIFIHQRGVGFSTPSGELKENNTNKLIEDMEALRKKLKIKKWDILGWSWGSALSLLYAQKHPKKIKSLTIFGAYSASCAEIEDSILGKGKQSQEFCHFMQETNINKILKKLDNKLNSSKDSERLSYLYQYEKLYNPQIEQFNDFLKTNKTAIKKRLNNVKIYVNYMKNGYFVKDRTIVKNAEKIKNIPVHIINGVNDMSTKLVDSMKLNQELKNSKITIIPYTGHNIYDEKAQKHVKKAMEQLCKRVTPTLANDNKKQIIPINRDRQR
jgi:proline iminopeptidase